MASISINSSNNNRGKSRRIYIIKESKMKERMDMGCKKKFEVEKEEQARGMRHEGDGRGTRRCKDRPANREQRESFRTFGVFLNNRIQLKRTGVSCGAAYRATMLVI